MRAITSPDLAEQALAAAEGRPCIVLVTESGRVDLRWARTTLTTNGSARSREVTVIAFDERADGTAVGSVTRSDPADRDDLARVVADAIDASRSASVADDVAPLVPGGQSPDWGEGAAEPGSTADVARALGDLFTSCRAADIEVFGYAEESTSTTWLASSTGLRHRHAQSQARLEVTAKSHGRSRSTWWGAAADTLAGIEPREADPALRRALEWQASEVVVEPGRHRAILSPGAIGDLMVDMWWSALARDAVEGRSVFSAPGGGTRLGERLGRLPLDLVSDSADPVLACDPRLAVAASSAYASVFDNGVPVGRTEWLAGGVLGGLISTRSFSSSSGVPFTPAADNLTLSMSGGVGDLDHLVSQVDDGILITCLWYNRVVDPQTLLLTGLTRDGVYLVRGGEVVGSVGNFRFNDSPVAMLDRVTAVGATARTMPREMGDYAPRVAMPAVVVEDFHLSTRSDAR